MASGDFERVLGPEVAGSVRWTAHLKIVIDEAGTYGSFSGGCWFVVAVGFPE